MLKNNLLLFLLAISLTNLTRQFCSENNQMVEDIIYNDMLYLDEIHQNIYLSTGNGKKYYKEVFIDKNIDPEYVPLFEDLSTNFVKAVKEAKSYITEASFACYIGYVQKVERDPKDILNHPSHNANQNENLILKGKYVRQEVIPYDRFQNQNPNKGETFNKVYLIEIKPFFFKLSKIFDYEYYPLYDSFVWKLDMMYKMAKAVKKVHSKQMVHLNINLQSFHFANHFQHNPDATNLFDIFLSEFEFAKHIKNVDNNWYFGEYYTFDKSILEKIDYDYSTDIYALGVCFHDILTLHISKDEEGYFKYHQCDPNDPSQAAYCIFQNLIEKMIDPQKEHRPNIKEVISLLLNAVPALSKIRTEQKNTDTAENQELEKYWTFDKYFTQEYFEVFKGNSKIDLKKLNGFERKLGKIKKKLEPSGGIFGFKKKDDGVTETIDSNPNYLKENGNKVFVNNMISNFGNLLKVN